MERWRGGKGKGGGDHLPYSPPHWVLPQIPPCFYQLYGNYERKIAETLITNYKLFNVSFKNFRSFLKFKDSFPKPALNSRPAHEP